MTDVITKPTLELEGTWEEILAHAAQLSGRRVRLVVLPLAAPQAEYKMREDEHTPSLSPENQRLLAVLDDLDRNPWTAEEMAALDGFERFNKEHPLSLEWHPKDGQ